jgi:hypothetical protein
LARIEVEGAALTKKLKLYRVTYVKLPVYVFSLMAEDPAAARAKVEAGYCEGPDTKSLPDRIVVVKVEDLSPKPVKPGVKLG